MSGKAFEAYSRLPVSSSNDFDLVKQAILERYGLNALAYRDKFRYAKQSKGETFKEYAVRVECYFNHWVQAEKAESNYQKLLYDLLLREQLMFTASHDLQILLRERNPHTFKELTEKADTYQLAHKHPNTIQAPQKETNVGTTTQGVTGTFRTNQGQGAIQKQGPDGIRRCYFCGSPDHLISNCLEKKSREGKSKDGPGGLGTFVTHTNALLLSPKKTDDDCYKVKVPLTVQMNSADVKQLENGLKVVRGEVNGNEAWILRDTGCTTVCMSRDFAEMLSLNSKAERRITLANGSECLCHEIEIDLQSPYLSGTVLALTMDCPFAEIILGESAFLKVSYQIREETESQTEKCRHDSMTNDDESLNYLEVRQDFENADEMPFPSIVSSVETRSMKTLRETDEIKQATTEEQFLKEMNTGKKDSVSYKLENYISGKENLKQEQEDATLDKVRKLAKLKEEEREETYFFYKENLLYRRFKMSNGDVLVQIVVPYKYRHTIMKTAHDMPLWGHLGNKKTRERILNHFCWPGNFPTVAKF